MLDHGDSSVLDVGYQLYGSLDVQHVVIGYLLAVELLGKSAVPSEVNGFLVRILAVAEVCRLSLAARECRDMLLPIEILEYMRVVAGALEES